jgi:hypothetical protein
MYVYIYTYIYTYIWSLQTPFWVALRLCCRAPFETMSYKERSLTRMASADEIHFVNCSCSCFEHQESHQEPSEKRYVFCHLFMESYYNFQQLGRSAPPLAGNSSSDKLLNLGSYDGWCFKIMLFSILLGMIQNH